MSLRHNLSQRLLFLLLALITLPGATRAQSTTRTLDASACASAAAPSWCAGRDLGAWINAAGRALGSAPGTIAISAPGSAATAIALSAGHSLQIDAPITLPVPATLNGKQTVRCSGPLASITSPAGPVFVGSEGADSITLEGCTFTNTNSTMVYTRTFLTNLSILHNTGGCLLLQDRFGKSPGTNYLIEGNTAVSCPNAAAVYITQFWNHVRVLGNHFLGGGSGAEWFGPDASTYPSYATLTAGSSKNAIFANNTCEGMGATCAWGSGMWRTLMQGNSADGCADICYDLEGSADSAIVANTCRNAGTCAVPAFFTGYHNSVIGNDFVQSNGLGLLGLKNNNRNAANIQDITISNNSLTCAGILCAVLHAETSVGLTFSGNHVLNGRFDNVGVQVQGVIEDNVFDYTVQALPGAGNNVNAGFNTPSQYHSYVTVKNNVINTRIPQAPGTWCINAAETDPTGDNVFYLEGNQCTGNWTGGIFLAGEPATYFLHNNFLPALPTAGPRSILHAFGNNTPTGAHD